MAWIFSMSKPAFATTVLCEMAQTPADAEIDAALRAHWPSYDRMRPDCARKWREKMIAALIAAAITKAKE